MPYRRHARNYFKIHGCGTAAWKSNLLQISTIAYSVLGQCSYLWRKFRRSKNHNHRFTIENKNDKNYQNEREYLTDQEVLD